MFVESGLGVKVKFDLLNTVYLTVTAEHLSATRGLCGVYNNYADGDTCVEHWNNDSSFGSYIPLYHVINLMCLISVDDFTTMDGTVSLYAASFGNSWKVPDQHSEVLC